MDLRTLADVRELLTHLPERCRKSRRGDTVTACLEEAALDGDTQNVAVPLRMVLSMEAMDAPRSSRISSGMLIGDSRTTAWCGRPGIPVAGSQRGADRRGEQQGHPPGLALVPVTDKTLGVLWGHLGIDRVPCDGLCACLSVS
jgi:hypothetical protein